MFKKSASTLVCTKFATRWRLCVAAALVAVTSPAVSQDAEFISSEDALGLINTVNIFVSDEVSDGCWTNSRAIEAKMRLLFEQNGINVELEDLAFFTVHARFVYANAVGYRTNGLCVGSARFAVYYNSSTILGGFDGLPEFRTSGLVETNNSSSVFSNSRDLNQQLTDFFEESATSFVADVLLGRRSEAAQLFRNTYPAFGTKAMTRTEWQSFINGVGND